MLERLDALADRAPDDAYDMYGERDGEDTDNGDGDTNAERDHGGARVVRARAATVTATSAHTDAQTGASQRSADAHSPSSSEDGGTYATQRYGNRFDESLTGALCSA